MIMRGVHWLRASLEEVYGRASGKSITAFLFSLVFAYANIQAIHGSDTKTLDGNFITADVTLILSLFGLKVVNKYINPEDKNPPLNQDDPTKAE